MDDHTTTIATSTTGFYHRILQQINSTSSSSDSDREAGFISVGLLVAILFLGLSMFVVNTLVEKYWYVFVSCYGFGMTCVASTSHSLYIFKLRTTILKKSPGWCVVSSNQDTAAHTDTTNEGNIANSTLFPYSSEIRELYLDSALKSQVRQTL
jgi:hypothetical protein